FSFPSGHTAASFASVTALWLAGKKQWAMAALPVGVLIAFSRMYLCVHYPTDILGGVILGAACGWAGACLVKKAERRMAIPRS
ncbi:MAG: phosphatase PAP2 family protein, partial [Faecalibacterium prausnitzii]